MPSRAPPFDSHGDVQRRSAAVAAAEVVARSLMVGFDLGDTAQRIGRCQ